MKECEFRCFTPLNFKDFDGTFGGAQRCQGPCGGQRLHRCSMLKVQCNSNSSTPTFASGGRAVLPHISSSLLSSLYRFSCPICSFRFILLCPLNLLLVGERCVTPPRPPSFYPHSKSVETVASLNISVVRKLIRLHERTLFHARKLRLACRHLKRGGCAIHSLHHVLRSMARCTWDRLSVMS